MAKRKVERAPEYQPAGNGLQILGGLGVLLGLLVIVIALVRGSGGDLAAQIGAAFDLDLGGGLFGGGLVLIGLGEIVSRLEVLCHYARLNEWDRRRPPQVETEAARRSEPPAETERWRIEPKL